MEKEENVLFVCVGNAGRSQMAEAFAKKNGYKASSAGTNPSDKISPIVTEVMKEKNIDISFNVPKMLTEELIENASIIVTMGCSVEKMCPKPMLAKMQKKLIEWEIEDPKGKPIEKVRLIQNKIENKILELFWSK